MSAEPKPPFEVHQERDTVDRVKVRGSAILAFLTIAVSLVVTVLFIRACGGPTERTETPAAVGTVETTLIRATERGLTLRSEQRAKLDHYRWIDRDAGVAQIPIDRAMDIIADGGSLP